MSCSFYEYEVYDVLQLFMIFLGCFQYLCLATFMDRRLVVSCRFYRYKVYGVLELFMDRTF